MIYYSYKSIASAIFCIAGTIAGSQVLAGDIVLSLEEPTVNSTYSGVANIRGWVVGSAGIERVELYVDGALATNVPSGGLRPDIGAAYPSYPDSSKSGFSMAFNYSNLAAGQHTVSVRAVDKSGAVEDASATFSVARFDNPFIDDAAKVSLDGATVSLDGQAIVINNLTRMARPTMFGWTGGPRRKVTRSPRSRRPAARPRPAIFRGLTSTTFPW